MLADVLGPLPPGAGPIGLLSGDEFTPAVREFDRALLQRTGPRVTVLTCADPANSEATAEHARAHFAALQADTTHAPGLPHDLSQTDLLYLAGGDPRTLLEEVNVHSWRGVLDRWKEGMGIAGASAGAMVLSEHCLVPQPGDDKPTTWTRGLGPIKNLGLAVHATTRPAEWLQQVANISRLPVVALDDATGIIIQESEEPIVIGPGNAWIV